MDQSGLEGNLLCYGHRAVIQCRLPRDLVRRIDEAVRGLERDPRPPGCRKLSGHETLYRIRVGDWRIIYAVEEDRLVVLVIEITLRGDAYRHL